MNRALLAAARGTISLLSPAGPRGRLTTLIYHRVMERPDPLRPGEPTAETFRWQMEVVARLFNVIPLHEAVDRLRRGALPRRAACITFDDGYADNAALAVPILQRLGLPATVFVATGFLNGGRMFNDTVIEWVRQLPPGRHDLDALGVGAWQIDTDADRLRLVRALLPLFKYQTLVERERCLETLEAIAPAELPNNLMMRDDQVQAIAAGGIDIGAHTMAHPILSLLPDGAVEEELEGSRRYLQKLVGSRVRLFAYPNGRYGSDYGDREVAAVDRLGFDGAVSTHAGVANAATDVFQLPRFTPWDREPERFTLRFVRNLIRS
ncbi:polysaccharide deacetylase family protein [Aquisalimonas sp. APHAB1-3]|uniref:polysaccharide deacetylase family protein n=1 Tax=Aquisalimonas sp. APHAB1-3 TaxID=3402080 RepID=UPI003AAA9EE1